MKCITCGYGPIEPVEMKVFSKDNPGQPFLYMIDVCPACGSQSADDKQMQSVSDAVTAMLNADKNVHTIPTDVGRPHTATPDCWCEPMLVGDYTKNGGVKHYLHRDYDS